MENVKTVKIDGEFIHFFNSAIYIFESKSGFTLEVDLIVSEVVIKKYKNEETLITEIELEDGRMISSFMNVKILSGRLPQINLFMELEEPNEYYELHRISENDASFPNIEEGITIEEIRKVEMPTEKVTLKLNLPINQVEWLNNQKPKELNRFFEEIIYRNWNK